MEKTLKIAVLAGDGIGPEVMDVGVNVLEAVAEKCGFGLQLDHQLIGGAAIDSILVSTKWIELTTNYGA